MGFGHPEGELWLLGHIAGVLQHNEDVHRRAQLDLGVRRVSVDQRPGNNLGTGHVHDYVNSRTQPDRRLALAGGFRRG